MSEVADNPYRYGWNLAQVFGITPDGRPFYFRSRHGYTTIHVGEAGWPSYADEPSWPNDGTLIAEQSVDGEIGIIEPDEVDAFIDQHLGAGWRHAS